MAMPKVALGSVEGTTLKNGTPSRPSRPGTQSMGIKSIRFMQNTQKNMVSANGATMLFLAEKEPRTLLSTNSMAHSQNFCRPLGAPETMLVATRRNRNMITAPNSSDMMKVSRLSAQNPMALASSALCAMPQVPSGNWP